MNEAVNTGGASLSWRVSDRRFVAQLNQLRDLKQFLFEEKILIKDEDLSAIDLGSLNNFKYSRAGRTPEDREWGVLDYKLSRLTSYLNEDLRRKIRIRELGTFFYTLPIIFLIIIALDVLLVNVVYGILPKIFPWLNSERQHPLSASIYSLMVISWPAAQGGLGACAFLGTVAIGKSSQRSRLADSSESREIADVTDRNFLQVRLLLGVLFGFLIGIPFASQSLTAIGDWLFLSKPSTPAAEKLPIVFIPFLIGFSTNLIFVILSRFIMAIEIFFGLTSKTEIR